MSLLFGNRLRKYRRKMGWSQEELANKMGVTSAIINNWEIGENSPDVEEIEKLSKIFCVLIEELVNKDPKRETYFTIDGTGIYYKDDEDEISIRPDSIFYKDSNNFPKASIKKKMSHEQRKK